MIDVFIDLIIIESELSDFIQIPHDSISIYFTM